VAHGPRRRGGPWRAACAALASVLLAGLAQASPFLHPVDASPDAPLLALDEASGRLRYGLYAERGGDVARHIVPDFSHAGFRGGGVALPARDDVPVRVVLAPTDDGGDDAPRIQAALDAVGALPADARGMRGAVLLRRGRYALDAPLRLLAGGVVLRGEGQGEDGTVLRSRNRARQARLIEVGAPGSAAPPAAADPRRQAIADAHVPVGAMRLRLASAEGYRAGDAIALVRTPDARWTGPEGIDTARFGWDAAAYAMHYDREVVAVDGDALVLDAPVVDAIDARFGGGHVYRSAEPRIAMVGIEDLQLQGDPATGVAVGTPDAGPYTAIALRAVRDAWVRDVTVRYLSHAVSAHHGARFITVQDVAYLEPRFGATEGMRRYVFHLEGRAGGVLVQRTRAEGGRHTFVTGAKTTGPNVFLDGDEIAAGNDSGPHQRWATGTLYDNTRGHLLRAQQRRWSGSGHGWAGAQQMFWRTRYEGAVLQAPPRAMNWAVGHNGPFVPGKFPPEEPAGLILSADAALPPSLYLQQLRDRLGPEAVLAVTTAGQRARLGLPSEDGP
jgi:hypothetical protein